MQSASFLFEQLESDLLSLLALLGIEPVPDLVTGTRGLYRCQPVAAGCVVLLGGDLDDVAVGKLVGERDNAAVCFCSRAGVSNLGVNGIGEIDLRRFPGQGDQLAARREYIDLFGVKIDFQRRQKIAGILHVTLPLDELAQPRHASVLDIVGANFAFFVFPVSAVCSD